jgi:hypothetical protein
LVTKTEAPKSEENIPKSDESMSALAKESEAVENEVEAPKTDVKPLVQEGNMLASFGRGSGSSKSQGKDMAPVSPDSLQKYDISTRLRAENSEVPIWQNQVNLLSDSWQIIFRCMGNSLMLSLNSFGSIDPISTC